MRSLLTGSLLMLGYLACDTMGAGKGATLKFQYDQPEALIPSGFATAMAAGFKADIRCFGENGASEPATASQATSSSPSVASVTTAGGNKLHLEAHAAGTTEIAVVTSLGEDAFDLTVVDLAKLDVSAPGALVPDSPASKGMVGGAARFFVTLRGANDRIAIGYGTLPITITPTEAGTVDPSTATGYALIHFATEGNTTVTGQGDDPIAIEVVAQAAVTGLELKQAEGGTQLKVGGTTVTVLRGKTDLADTVVGVASLATIASSDTAICTVAPNLNLGEGTYIITGKAVGTCQVNATFGTLTATLPVTVSP